MIARECIETPRIKYPSGEKEMDCWAEGVK